MKVGILTISDRCAKGEREDKTKETIKEVLGISDFEYRLVPDEYGMIREALTEMSLSCELILTNGGTGISPSDITPEATASILDKEIPGIPEAMRKAGLKYTPNSILSRAKAGIRGKALIINLPGSPNGASECLSSILPAIPHAISLIKGEVKECAR
ncbi:MAG: MogA/MoaB family molybdenum cofactor biosynthesis protein [bacterium]